MGTEKRRGGDSNPRYRHQYNSLAGSPIRPLSHLSKKMAPKQTEKVGFEPTEPLGSTVFKTASFDHSDTSPNRFFTILSMRRFVNIMGKPRSGNAFSGHGELAACVPQ